MTDQEYIEELQTIINDLKNEIHWWRAGHIMYEWLGNNKGKLEVYRQWEGYKLDMLNKTIKRTDNLELLEVNRTLRGRVEYLRNKRMKV